MVRVIVQGGNQDAPKGVTDGVAETPLQRFAGELAVVLGVRILVHLQARRPD